MKNTRALAAVIGSTVLVGVAALTTAALAGDDTTTRTSQEQTINAEPAGDGLPDGTYFGYVRRTGLDDPTLAIDFVSLEDGRVRNRQPERVIDGGLLANVDIFGLESEAFRIVIKDGTITWVETTDVIPAPTEQPDNGPGDWFFDDGELSVVIDGQLHNVPDQITEALDSAISSDIADRGDDGHRVDVAAWLADHPATADAVADLAVIRDGNSRVDVSEWLAEHPSVSDAEWWDFERSVLRALLEGDQQ